MLHENPKDKHVSKQGIFEYPYSLWRVDGKDNKFDNIWYEADNRVFEIIPCVSIEFTEEELQTIDLALEDCGYSKSGEERAIRCKIAEYFKTKSQRIGHCIKTTQIVTGQQTEK